jgi:hypothetical protein
MWTPDVYEGAPTAITALLRHRAQGGRHGALRPRVHDAFGGAVGDWQQIVAFLAVLSMFLGAVAAIGQTDIKRLMAYSSIAHMGFALMGLAAGTAQGVEAMLIYMAIYVTMNVGTFAFILTMERDGQPVTEIIRAVNLRQREPGQGAGAAGADVLASPACRRWWASSASTRAAAAVEAGSLARRGRRDRLGDRRLLLPAHRLLHVFRRGARGSGRVHADPALCRAS